MLIKKPLPCSLLFFGLFTPTKVTVIAEVNAVDSEKTSVMVIVSLAGSMLHLLSHALLVTTVHIMEVDSSILSGQAI